MCKCNDDKLPEMFCQKENMGLPWVLQSELIDEKIPDPNRK